MMHDGTLLHIPNYVFENGTSKDKFFLVLKEIDDLQLIVSLPSSIEYFPTGTIVNHGCVDLHQAQQTTYCFKAGNIIDSTTSFSFSKDTYLHGCWLKDIDKNLFFQKYPVQDFHYVIKGIIDPPELKEIINCFKNSSSVKQRIKKLL
ncbi:MAG: hypothetical protein EBR38_01825 [Flavobacteriaceae bacterium]|nr:hypothetical protein [Flavobacteriaceae bacterium]